MCSSASPSPRTWPRRSTSTASNANSWSVKFLQSPRHARSLFCAPKNQHKVPITRNRLPIWITVPTNVVYGHVLLTVCSSLCCTAAVVDGRRGDAGDRTGDRRAAAQHGHRQRALYAAPVRLQGNKRSCFRQFNVSQKLAVSLVRTRLVICSEQSVVHFGQKTTLCCRS